MKFRHLLCLISLMSFSAWAEANFKEKALKLVPGGVVQSVDEEEVIVKTKAGTLVEIELNKDSTLDEASGSAALKDEFVPGEGLLTLKEAVEAMKKQGKEVTGEWSLDKDTLRDWEYEFEGFEGGRKYEYTLNAKTGKLVKSEAD